MEEQLELDFNRREFHVKYIPVEDVTEEHLEVLQRYFKHDYQGETLETICRLVMEKKAFMFYGQRGRSKGVAVVQLLQYPAGLEFYVFAMAGTRGALKNFDEIMEQLEAFARKAGCAFIGAITRPGIARLCGRRRYATLGVRIRRTL